MKIKQMIELDYRIICQECGDELKAYQGKGLEEEIIVKPCKSCIEYAIEELRGEQCKS